MQKRFKISFKPQRGGIFRHVVAFILFLIFHWAAPNVVDFRTVGAYLSEIFESHEILF